MKINKIILILALIFLAQSCISKSNNLRIRPEMKPGKISFSDKIDKKIIKTKKFRFTSKENQVYAFIKIKNYSGIHKLSWKWYTPENNLYVETKPKTASARDNFYMEEFISYNHIDIKGYQAEDHKGKWKVEFYLNNNLENTGFFYLTN